MWGEASLQVPYYLFMIWSQGVALFCAYHYIIIASSTHHRAGRLIVYDEYTMVNGNTGLNMFAWKPAHVQLIT